MKRLQPLRKDIGSFWLRYRRNRMAVVAIGILAFLVFMTSIASQITPYGPDATSAENFVSPSVEHPLGTDDLGRDVFSRVVHGSRISITVGVFAGLMSLIIGISIGVTSGYAGGRIDSLLMRSVEVIQVIPRFFFAILLIAIFGSTIWNIIVAIGLLGWPSTARIVRAEVLSAKELPFVEAARLSGLSDFKIMFSEILPNTITSAIVNTALLSAAAIISEAGLSFLGLGDPNAVSLGLLLQQSYVFLQRAWWCALFPGIFVTLIVLGLNLLTDGITAALSSEREGR